uniref:Uncharacterized protein n=1 Tax=Romanomermis culicivorax TaxID=13658 RepID=A0A915HPG0_ROMCU
MSPVAENSVDVESQHKQNSESMVETQNEELGRRSDNEKAWAENLVKDMTHQNEEADRGEVKPLTCNTFALT